MLQFFGDKVGEKLVNKAIISRGITEFGKLHVGSFLFKVYRKLRSITLVFFIIQVLLVDGLQFHQHPYVLNLA